MSKVEIIEKAFERVNKIANGKLIKKGTVNDVVIWGWIENENEKLGFDNGEYDLEDRLVFNNEYSKVIYKIEVVNGYDEEEDIKYMDIELKSIKVNGKEIL